MNLKLDGGRMPIYSSVANTNGLMYNAVLAAEGTQAESSFKS